LFERTDGRIEIAGVEYSYVKRRIFNDSLEIMCIPNNAAMQLHNAKNNFFNLVNDLQCSQNKKTNSRSECNKSFSMDNYIVNELYQFNINRFTLSNNIIYYLENDSFDFSSIDEQPPDIMA
jgi:hypothetical protein